MLPLPQSLFGDASLFEPPSPRRSIGLPIGVAALVAAAILTAAIAITRFLGNEAGVAEPSGPCRILVHADYPPASCGRCECVEAASQSK